MRRNLSELAFSCNASDWIAGETDNPVYGVFRRAFAALLNAVALQAYIVRGEPSGVSEELNRPGILDSWRGRWQ